jgi:hypothetical protein
MDKAQSKTIHIGNIGEHLIGSLLSPYCIVRNVSQGRDTGIDLYCEILKKNSLELSLHFFCQVKTTKDTLNISDSKEYFDYWRNQPVPVFLFHVKYNDVNTINKEHVIWVYDIPWILAISDAKKGNVNIQRDVHDKFQICEEYNNKDKMTLDKFLYHHIPWSYGLWMMRRHGLVSPNPEIREQKQEFFVGSRIATLYKDKIEKSIGSAKWLLDYEKDSQ